MTTEREEVPELEWEIQLVAATPIAQTPLRVVARTEAEAKRKFCEANGIDDSGGVWTIKPTNL